jgi:hypothetical protein
MMSRLSLILILLLFSAKAIAPDHQVISLVESGSINPFEELIRAVMQVESSGDTLAYNAEEEAYGPLQIRPIRLYDYNKRTGKKYTMHDCFRKDVSFEIFLYYATLIGYPNFETIAKRWNGSGKLTITYWEKVKARLDES